jgi:hypothetical protein
MKLRSAFHLNVVLALSIFVAANTICGTEAATSKKASVKPASSSSLSPELTAAADKVNKTKAQLETSAKQLRAARALLKAAEADHKAAQAEYQALELRQHAQGLAQEAGLKEKGTAIAASSAANVDTVNSAPVANGNNQLDFTVEHLPAADLQSPTLR